MRNFGLSAPIVQKQFPNVPLANLTTNLPLVFSALEQCGILTRNVLIAANATIVVETAWTYAPIDEYGGNKYFTKMYEGRKDLGNSEPGDGARFKG